MYAFILFLLLLSISLWFSLQGAMKIKVNTCKSKVWEIPKALVMVAMSYFCHSHSNFFLYNSMQGGKVQCGVPYVKHPTHERRPDHNTMNTLSQNVLYIIYQFFWYILNISVFWPVSKWIWWTDFQKNITISEITSLQWVKTSQGARSKMCAASNKRVEDNMWISIEVYSLLWLSISTKVILSWFLWGDSWWDWRLKVSIAMHIPFSAQFHKWLVHVH